MIVRTISDMRSLFVAGRSLAKLSRYPSFPWLAEGS